MLRAQSKDVPGPYPTGDLMAQEARLQKNGGKPYLLMTALLRFW